MIDAKLTFWDQIHNATKKASEVTTSLNRLMANVYGPLPSKRRLLLRTAEAIMLYARENWTENLKYEKYRKAMASVQKKGALRVA